MQQRRTKKYRIGQQKQQEEAYVGLPKDDTVPGEPDRKMA